MVDQVVHLFVKPVFLASVTSSYLMLSLVFILAVRVRISRCVSRELFTLVVSRPIVEALRNLILTDFDLGLRL